MTRSNTLTEPRVCKHCPEMIRLLQTCDGHWHPVDAESKYLELDPDGPASGISNQTGKFLRGSWSWPKQGTAVVYPVHLCGGSHE